MLVAEEPVLVRHRLTAEQYHRMAEAGVIDAEARIELIEGEILEMAPIGTHHNANVSRLVRLFVRGVGDRAIVSVQQSLRLDAWNEPEPDFALLLPRDDFYAGALPTGRDAILVVEVAESSLAFDLRVKADLYARGGVPEYWVVDRGDRRLHRHCLPRAGRYGEVTSIDAPASMAVPGLDGVSIDLAGIFTG